MLPSTAESFQPIAPPRPLRRWGRRLAAGFALLLLAAISLTAVWVQADTAWGGLPPSSRLRTPLEARLPPALAALARLLPPRAAPGVDTATLPAWAAPPREPRKPTWAVADAPALARAMAQAVAGDVIEVQAGEIVVTGTLASGHGGRDGASIVLRGAPGARLVSRTVEAIKLYHPHWRIEHLHIAGDCTPAERCEHAVHIVGRAAHTELVGLELRNFNAAIKVNGEDGAWPDHGRLTHSLLANDAPRPGDAPATPFDLVGASFWHVEANQIRGVAKAGGNGIAYAAFMKGGGRGGRFERNLVICAPDAAHTGVGQQVGLSFGGGGTDPRTLRDRQTGLEHLQGQAVGNAVINCNDTALDANEAAAIEFNGNLVLGSGGLVVRGKGASAEARDNRLSRPGFAWPGNELRLIGNQRLPERPGPDATVAEEWARLAKR